jgi:hypothetical protein
LNKKQIFVSNNYKNMANTFSQIYIQVIFAVKGRENLISKSWKDELFKYIQEFVLIKIKN